MPKRSNLTKLQMEDSKLAAKEKFLTDMLNKIKSQKIALEIERMQLNSMLNTLENTYNGKSPVNKKSEEKENVKREELLITEPKRPYIINTNLLDEATSSINTKHLNLSIINDFDDTKNNCSFEKMEDSDYDDLL